MDIYWPKHAGLPDLSEFLVALPYRGRHRRVPDFHLVLIPEVPRTW